MRKFLSIIFCLIMVMGFTLIGEASAKKNCGVYGGIGFNNYSFASDLTEVEENNSGVNIFGGLRRWDLMDKFALGVEAGYANIDEAVDLSASSFLGTLTYRFPVSFKVRDGDWRYRYRFLRRSNFELRGIGAVGLYSVKNNQRNILTPGIKTGLECDLPVGERVILTTRAVYKDSNISLVDRKLNFKGWEFSGLLKKKF